MTTLITGPCSRERYLEECPCAACVAYQALMDGDERHRAVLLGVAGLVSAVHAWREEMLVGQREYIQLELQGMMMRQTRAMHALEDQLRALTAHP